LKVKTRFRAVLAAAVVMFLILIAYLSGGHFNSVVAFFLLAVIYFLIGAAVYQEARAGGFTVKNAIYWSIAIALSSPMGIAVYLAAGRYKESRAKRRSP
jgi:hypothetical protein